MKTLYLSDMTIDQLVLRFTEIALAQDDALIVDDVTRFNRLFAEMQKVSEELRSRNPDQRIALVRLYSHPNKQVQVKAAKHTLALVPDSARDLLEEIRISNWQPQALEAGMSLRNLDSGVFKPQ